VLKKRRKDITGVILSGGKNTRMGTNKSLLKFGGKTIIQRLVELLDSIFFEVIISSNKPEVYEFTKRNIIKDLIPDKGPLSGIHSALSNTSTEKVFILSCDMPLVTSKLINYLCDYNSRKQIVLPQAEDHLQQLCGIYSKSILTDVEALLIESQKPGSNFKGSIYELIKRVETKIIKVDKLEFYHPDIFLNVNTPEDYDHLKKIFKTK
jgi:molybdopterin-guanine dinucleotide biosynthesis protein A